MKFIKWFLTFLVGIILGISFIAVFNISMDPFGVFSDKLLSWYGFDMTNNPRIAKISYIDQYHENYDSYIIGSSKTSSVPIDLLNEYYGDAKFYNMFMYGADLAHIEKTVNYLIENYEVKNIIVHLSISELIDHDVKTDDVKQELHAKVSEESLAKFYLKYAFLSPKYGITKMNSYLSRNLQESPTPVDVFIPETGAYNKSKRDKENIVNITDYVNTISSETFLNNVNKYPTDKAEECLTSVRNMKDLCDTKGINFQIICAPNYDADTKAYDLDKAKDYWVELAQITPYWNFSGYNSISSDPRFFYDSVHYRNVSGRMMLAKIFDDKSVYVPDNFGVYVTPENAKEVSAKILTPNPDMTGYVYPEEQEEPVKVPVLMFHHIVADSEPTNNATISVSEFQNHMTAIKDAGYEPVFLTELADYVNRDGTLPEKPIVITFDDGYESNYKYAFPILKDMNMKATINIIGWSVGQDTYPDGKKIIPHFTWEEAKEMQDSGIVDIQAHTFDMHNDGQTSPYRNGVLMLPDESTNEYKEAILDDNAKMNALFEQNLNKNPTAIAYPYGLTTLITDKIFTEDGYEITMTTSVGVSSIRKNCPYTLYALNRINVSSGMSPDELLEIIQ